MDRPDAAHTPISQDLLTPGEPPAWEELNSESPSPLLLLCDHASNRVPQKLAHLGLDLNVFGMHVAYDIGCEKLTRLLSSRFNATALLANYSRLVIDLNRHPGDGSSIPEVSDNIEIPGNHALTPEQIGQREEALFWPYHNRIERILGRIVSRGQTPVLCSIHSFTPIFRGFQRPWHIGVLWDRDQRLSTPLLESLRSARRFRVGDNEPYHARNPVGYTMDVHGEKNGYPHLLLEIRQDLIGHDDGVVEWADIIHTHLQRVLTQVTVP
ncbi:N-formylglutamate amidohydrolase [Sedimenticola sp.]|uniref:N-formylglutamate amidohydrolase n=1 Tax=Sedimenticola sp. TaxID=1940285 RepID=UPI00258A2E05|nr:N-formylglutamate amidohydrolase [Sedimenticola sp.]MCW8904210.1 N-formylglutamate amidohydrolase [Sedimenticola sp.]